MSADVFAMLWNLQGESEREKRILLNCNLNWNDCIVPVNYVFIQYSPFLKKFGIFFISCITPIGWHQTLHLIAWYLNYRKSHKWIYFVRNDGQWNSNIDIQWLQFCSRTCWNFPWFQHYARRTNQCCINHRTYQRRKDTDALWSFYIW